MVAPITPRSVGLPLDMLALRTLRNLARGARLIDSPAIAGSLMQADAFNVMQAHGVTGSVYNVGAATNIK